MLTPVQDSVRDNRNNFNIVNTLKVSKLLTLKHGNLDGRQSGPEKHPDTSTISLKHIRFEILCMYFNSDTTYISAKVVYEF